MKSYVTLNMKICPICTDRFPDGILLDKHLNDRFERETYTGFKLCKECEEKTKTHLAFVEIDVKKSESLKAEDVHRLGRIMFVPKKNLSKDIKDKAGDSPLMWVPSELIDSIIKEKEKGEENGEEN